MPYFKQRPYGADITPDYLATLVGKIARVRSKSNPNYAHWVNIDAVRFVTRHAALVKVSAGRSFGAARWVSLSDLLPQRTSPK